MNKKEIEVKSNISLVDLLKTEGFKLFAIQKMLKEKDVKVNSKRVAKDEMLSVGDKVECFYESDKSLKQVDKIKLIYDDQNIAIAIKPIGVESCGDSLNTIEKLTGYIAVHRLDTNTSGLIILAKNEDVKEKFVDIFKNNLVEKRYICEVAGDSDFKGDIYSAFIFKDSKMGKVYVSNIKKSGYQEIKTRFKTIKHGQISSIVECELLTGKTHQIRAHLAYLGHPILGDNKYGKGKTNAFFKEKAQKLHCFYIKFRQIDDEKLNYLTNKNFTNYPNWFGGKNE